MYRPFADLNFGFINAENYQRNENKEMLQKYFVRDGFLERLLEPNIYFLVGEKGTGKTAYATFLANTDYRSKHAAIFDVRKTEYQKLLELKKRGLLPLSQYAELWRTLLLMTVATSILRRSGTPKFLRRFTKLGALKSAIDEFFERAFAPEIVKMISFVELSELATNLIAKHMPFEASAGAKSTSEKTDLLSVFQTNLLRIRLEFESALKALRLENDALIFIDGIDVRPSDIPYADYFDCVSGLLEAVWAINNDFLGNIKDSKGRIRVVLLVRPDIFLRTGLHNLNTKLRDNSVFLNWTTTYKDYEGSSLFKVADRMLAVQQETLPAPGDAWKHYFPFSAGTQNASGSDSSFVSFLRFSYYRPRDINSMMRTIQDFVKAKRRDADHVEVGDFNDPTFRDAHAEYLLGEIRDQLLFYYSQDEYVLFLQFFSHLRGKRTFSYSQFVDAFNEFIGECTRSSKALPQFFESADVFLQFIYEQNVVCFKERDGADLTNPEPFIRWCFRERTLSNMAPKVRVGVDYEIFYGLSKALNVGREIRVAKTELRRDTGTVCKLNDTGSFGFIRGGKDQSEYYFKFSDVDNRSVKRLRLGQRVTFEIQVKYGKLRARAVAVE